MDDDRRILEQAIAWREAGHRVALATVIAGWGSSPRPVGSHLAVRADGIFVGSVSGGCVESDVVTRALASLETREAEALEFGVSAWRHGLSCGGRITVLVHPLDDVESLRSVVATMAAGRGCAIRFGITDGSTTLSSDARTAAVGNDVFVRVYSPAPRLVIAGAVHIAEHLARMAEMIGFETRVFDPRRGFAERGGFDHAPFVGWPEDFFAVHPADAATAVVSLTHTGRIDHPTIVAALRSEAFYVGALGSRVTHAKRLTRLEGEGFGSADLQRIHGPVGLPIRAGSPAEIAVSILAQLIDTWRGRDERN